jgi:hypothetical protein
MLDKTILSDPNVTVRFFSGSARIVSVDLGTELQRIYDSEINIRISWLWDGGIEVRLGDEVKRKP